MTRVRVLVAVLLLVSAAVVLACVGEDPDVSVAANPPDAEAGPDASDPDSANVSDGAADGTADAGAQPTRTLIVLGGVANSGSDRTFYGVIERTGIKWTEGARLPGHWAEGCAVATDAGTLLAGGFDSIGTLRQAAHQPSNDPFSSWKPTSGPPRQRKSAGCVGLSTGLLVVGGSDSYSTTQYVDVDLATVAADGGTAWTPGPSLPMPVQAVAVAYAEGHVYAAGGYPCTPRIVSWDPDGAVAWNDAGALSAPSYGAAVASDGKRIFLSGGFEGSSCQTVSSSVLVLGLADGGVTSLSAETSLPDPRVDHRAAVVGSKLYVLGGRFTAGGIPTRSVVSATIAADGTLGTWSNEKPLPVALADFALAVR